MFNTTKLAEFLSNNSNDQDNGVLLIDLEAIKNNYRIFANEKSIIPVLKANAYGLGVCPIATALYEAGAREFFVATIDEAIELRNHLFNCETIAIYVLIGLLPNTKNIYKNHSIIPVLNSLEQILRWNEFGKNCNKILDCVVHYDTGMSRTGLDEKDAQKFVAMKNKLLYLNFVYIMTHLCCGDDKSNKKNIEQYKKFQSFTSYFPEVKQSFYATSIKNEAQVNSVSRVGIGLYGFAHSIAESEHYAQLGIQQAVHVYSKIIQVRQVEANTSVGYGASYITQTPAKLITLSIGYADGYLRGISLNMQNREVYVYIESYKAKLVGRCSMDFCVADVSDIPNEFIYEKAWVQMLGVDVASSQLLENTNITGHELLIALGNSKRLKRIYLNE